MCGRLDGKLTSASFDEIIVIGAASSWASKEVKVISECIETALSLTFTAKAAQSRIKQENLQINVYGLFWVELKPCLASSTLGLAPNGTFTLHERPRAGHIVMECMKTGSSARRSALSATPPINIRKEPHSRSKQGSTREIYPKRSEFATENRRATKVHGIEHRS